MTCACPGIQCPVPVEPPQALGVRVVAGPELMPALAVVADKTQQVRPMFLGWAKFTTPSSAILAAPGRRLGAVRRPTLSTGHHLPLGSFIVEAIRVTKAHFSEAGLCSCSVATIHPSLVGTHGTRQGYTTIGAPLMRHHTRWGHFGSSHSTRGICHQLVARCICRVGQGCNRFCHHRRLLCL